MHLAPGLLGCGALWGWAHPTFPSQSHTSLLPEISPTQSFPPTPLSTSWSWGSISLFSTSSFKINTENYLYLPFLRQTPATTSLLPGAFVLDELPASQLFASCPPMPHPHHLQRIEKFNMNCCHYCKDRLRGCVREGKREMGRDK